MKSSSENNKLKQNKSAKFALFLNHIGKLIN